MALKPGAWNMELHRLGELIYLVTSLTAYGVRIARHGLASKTRQ